MTRIDEIGERAKKATKGPWYKHGFNIGPQLIPEANVLLEIAKTFKSTDDNREHNADFIAHSRADIPYLLELVDEAGSQLPTVIQWLSEYFRDKPSPEILEVVASLQAWLRKVRG